jgi:hypothetical protein
MTKPVSSKIVKEVLADLHGKNQGYRWKWVFMGLVVFVSLAVIFWLSFYGKTFLSNIVDFGPWKSRPILSPGEKSVSPSPDEGTRTNTSPLGMKIRKEVPEPKEPDAESTVSMPPLSQEPSGPMASPSGTLQQTSEPVNILSPQTPGLSSPQTLPAETENKAAADSPKSDPLPNASEVQKADGKKGRTTGAPPDPSEIVDWLLRKRSTKDH